MPGALKLVRLGGGAFLLALAHTDWRCYLLLAPALRRFLWADAFPALFCPAPTRCECFLDFAHAGGRRYAAGRMRRLDRLRGRERVPLIAVARHARQSAVPTVVVCAVVGVGLYMVKLKLATVVHLFDAAVPAGRAILLNEGVPYLPVSLSRIRPIPPSVRARCASLHR